MNKFQSFRRKLASPKNAHVPSPDGKSEGQKRNEASPFRLNTGRQKKDDHTKKANVEEQEPSPRTVLSHEEVRFTAPANEKRRRKGSGQPKTYHWKNFKSLMVFSPKRRRQLESESAYSDTNRNFESDSDENIPISHSRAQPFPKNQRNTEPADQEPEEKNSHITHGERSKQRGVDRSSSLADNRSTRDIDSLPSTREISNYGTFPISKKLAPTIAVQTTEGKKSALERREGEPSGSLHVTPIRQEAGKRKNDPKVTQDPDNEQLTRSRTKILQKLTAKIVSPSSWYSKDGKKHHDENQALGAENTVNPDTTVDFETPPATSNWSQVSKLVPDGASKEHQEVSKGREIKGEEQQISSCPATEDEQSQSFVFSFLRRAGGPDHQDALANGRSNKTVTLRSFGAGRTKETSNPEDLESPWGVKGEVDSAAVSFESRQTSKTMLNLISMNEIVSALGQGIKNMRVDACRDSDLHKSEEGTPDTNNREDKNGRNPTECEKIEMFKDAFVEYTVRAQQSSNRTIIKRCTRKMKTNPAEE